MIEELRKRFGIHSPAEVIKVGDTPSDLLEGKNAGCGKTIGVLYGTHNRAELEDYPHDYLAENIEDLTKAILSDGT
jgi:phosphoglycolate phosphatase-like HAD superfamily hydrolase